MSRKILNPSRTMPSLSAYKIGDVSKTISLAFGNPVSIPKSTNSDSRPTKKLLGLKENKLGRNIFVTHTEINEMDIFDNTKEALTYQEMITEVDALRTGMKAREDSLEDLRRRIARCQAGINAQENNYHGLHRTVKDIDSRNKQLLQRFKSMCAIPRKTS